MRTSYKLRLSFSLLFLVLFTFCSDDDVIQYQLTTRVIPEGSGTVSPESTLLNKGTEVQIQATPGAEYIFKSWSDDVAGDENPMTVVMTDDMVITANFEKRTYPLAIEIVGQGTVKEEVVAAKFSKDYPSGTAVQLTAIPEQEWEFVRWEGDHSGTENPLIMTVTNPIELTAVFQKINYALTIEIIGQGTVKEEVVAAKTSTDYPSGTTVQLTAVPEAEWKFLKWSGDQESDENPLTLSITEPLSLTATFEPISQEQVFVPDDNFEQALIDLGLDDELDDFVLTLDIAKVETLNISNKNISDLTGIEGFESLKYLYASNNKLMSIPVSFGLNTSQGAPAGPQFPVGILDLSDNNISSLNISELSFFNLLMAKNNPLTCIIATEEQIQLISNAMLFVEVDEGVEISIDCSINDKDKTYVPDDQFEQALIDLGLDDIMDDYVNTQNILNVAELDISGNNISDVTGLEDFIFLVDLNCSNNNISDVSGLENLKRIIVLNCSNNNITSIPDSFGEVWGGVYPPFVDGKLDLSNNQLSNLDVSGLNFFTELDVRNNPLICIEVNENQILDYIDSPSILTDEDVIISLDCGI